MHKPSAKALWLKEYRQARGLLGAIGAAVTAFLTLRLVQGLGAYERMVADGLLRDRGPLLHLHLFGFELSPVLAALVIALACLQIGAERSRGTDHFTFALPYPRWQIFLIKWALGALTITLALWINFGLSALRVAASPLREELVLVPPLLPYTAQMFGAALATYTLSLFLGALAGSAAYQAAFSVIFGIFPLGLAILLMYALDVHLEAFAGGPFVPPPWAAWLADVAAQRLSVLAHFWGLPTMITGSPWETDLAERWGAVLPVLAVDLAFVVIFLAWGAYLYGHNRLEYDGLMLVIPAARPLFAIGITVCFALLGGFIAGLGAPWHPAGAVSLVSYYLGAFALGGLAYAVTRRLLRRAAPAPGEGS